MKFAFWAVLLISMTGPAWGADGGGPPKLECGNYRVSGKLRETGEGLAVLSVHAGTSERFDLVIHRLSADDAVKYAGKNIQVDVKIYRAGSGSEAGARAVSAPHSATREQAERSGVQLLQAGKCG